VQQTVPAQSRESAHDLGSSFVPWSGSHRPLRFAPQEAKSFGHVARASAPPPQVDHVHHPSSPASFQGMGLHDASAGQRVDVQHIWSPDVQWLGPQGKVRPE
jgi:hypothetical protein